LYIIDRAFISEIELMAVVSSGLGIVKDGLVRSGDTEDILKDEGSFSGRDPHGDMEGQSKAEGIEGISDTEDRVMFMRLSKR